MLILQERQLEKPGCPVLHLLWVGFLLVHKPATVPAEALSGCHSPAV